MDKKSMEIELSGSNIRVNIEIYSNPASPATSPCPPLQFETSKNGTNSDDYEYNWFCIKPKMCKTCKNWVFIFVFLVVCVFVQSLVTNGIASAILSTIEKEFYLTSFQSGLFLAVFELVSVIASPIIGFIGDLRSTNKMRLMSVCLFIVSMGAYLIGCTVFIKQPDSSISEETQLNLCLVNRTINMTNKEIECSAITSSSQNKQQVNSLQYLLYIGNGIIGVGSVAMYTVGIAYIEEIVPAERSPICQAIFNGVGALGGGIGIIATGQFLQIDSRFYLGRQTTLTSSSANWIGCWWLPWLIYGLFCNLLAIYVFGFPRSVQTEKCQTPMPKVIQTISQTIETPRTPGAVIITEHPLIRSGDITSRKEKSVNVQTTNKFEATRQILSAPATRLLVTKKTKCELFQKSIEKFFQEFKELLTNGPFVFLSLAYAAEGLLVNGFLGFISKYFEYQFQLQASVSSIITGGIALFSIIFGSLLGAYLITKFKWDAVKCTLAVVIAYFATSLSFWLLLLNCPQTAFITNNSVNKNNGPCDCENIYNPVCYRNKTTVLAYQSPCHCGCTSEYSNSTFTDCTCLEGLGSNETHNYVSFDQCDQGVKCFTIMIICIAGALFTVFISAAVVVPKLKAFLGTINTQQQAFGLGLRMALTKLIGNFTGPIIYGAVVDSTCIFWKTSCYDRSVCKQYDNEKMSRLLAIISFSCRFMSFLLVLITFYLFKLRQKKFLVIINKAQTPDLYDFEHIPQFDDNASLGSSFSSVRHSYRITKTSDMNMSKIISQKNGVTPYPVRVESSIINSQ